VRTTDLVVQVLREIAARRVHAADDLRDGRRREVSVAGVLALGRERQEEVVAALQPDSSRSSAPARRSCPGYVVGLQDDELAAAQTRADLLHGVDDVAHLRLALRRQRASGRR
jgi:hypothetical protein